MVHSACCERASTSDSALTAPYNAQRWHSFYNVTTPAFSSGTREWDRAFQRILLPGIGTMRDMVWDCFCSALNALLTRQRSIFFGWHNQRHGMRVCISGFWLALAGCSATLWANSSLAMAYQRSGILARLHDARAVSFSPRMLARSAIQRLYIYTYGADAVRGILLTL